MIEVELQIPTDTNSEAVITSVEEICNVNGLTCILKGMLASYSGCIHWHYKMGKQRGLWKSHGGKVKTVYGSSGKR